MAMLQMLPKMICTEELLALITLAELVDIRQVNDAFLPVGSGDVGEFLPAVAADVHGGYVVGGGGKLGIRIVRVVWCGGGGVEGAFISVGKGGTGPRVAADVEGVLVAFGFVFVLEFVVAVLAVVLLFGLVGSETQSLEKVNTAVSRYVPT